MFLAVKGAKSGKINGESQDSKHKDEIEVIAWSWGMQGKPSLGGGNTSGKATVRELRITKRVDKASTALMAALRNNELITEATLTLRKIGKNPLEYRSEEHTSELQSLRHLVCRLLLEKKKR